MRDEKPEEKNTPCTCGHAAAGLGRHFPAGPGRGPSRRGEGRDPKHPREGFIGGGCHAVDLLRWIAGDLERRGFPKGKDTEALLEEYKNVEITYDERK